MNFLLSCLVLSLGLSSLAIAAPDDPPLRSKPEARKPIDDADTVKGEDDEPTEGPAKRKEPRPAAVSSIDPEALVSFSYYPPQVQHLVREALALTKLNLPYTFGGTSPKDGGMDCSGTIYHLLNKLGLKGVPRQSDEMCAWVQGATLLHRTPTAEGLMHPEFASLQPGDLLFWSGTYETGPRKIPVTHVMLYLGKLKKGGHVAFGASDGRYFQGERRNGVSVFDLSVPSADSKSHLYGYGLIPGVGRIVPPPPPPPVVVAEVKPITEPTPVVATVIPKDAAETILPAEPARKAPSVAVVKLEAAKTPAIPRAASDSPAKKPSVAKTSSDAPAKKRTQVKRPPPEPTPKEQLTQAARKVVNTLKDVFTR